MLLPFLLLSPTKMSKYRIRPEMNGKYVKRENVVTDNVFFCLRFDLFDHSIPSIVRGNFRQNICCRLILSFHKFIMVNEFV